MNLQDFRAKELVNPGVKAAYEAPEDKYTAAQALMNETLKDEHPLTRALMHPHETEELCQEEHWVLSPRDTQVFIEALLNPPWPGLRLRQAMENYKKHVQRS